MKNNFLKFFVGLLCFMAVIVILIILFNDFASIGWTLLLNTLLLFGFCLVSHPCYKILDKYKNYSIVSLSLNLISFIWSSLQLWSVIENKSVTGQLWLTLIILSIVNAHISTLLTVDDKSKKSVIIIRNITITLIIITSIIVIIPIWEFDFINLFGKEFLVLIILNLLGTIVTPILSKINS